jgi:Tol biopolymer transport system component
VVVGLVVAVGVLPAGAAVPGSNGRLAVVRLLPDDGFGVTTMEADGSDPRRVFTLAGSGDNILDIDWSPDASRIAVNPCCGKSVPHSIVSIAADGSDPRDLLRRAGHPAWSPNGSRLAFERYGRDDRGDFHSWIFLADADGSNLVQLTGDRSPRAFSPAWSPDGSSIAFSRIDAGTLAIKPLGGGAPAIVELPERVIWAEHLEWSPDGSMLSFVGNTCYGDCAEIWTLDVDAGAFAQLTRTPTAVETDADWSPDGSTIVYVRWDDPGFASSDLWFMDPDGTDKRSVETRRLEFVVDWGVA